MRGFSAPQPSSRFPTWIAALARRSAAIQNIGKQTAPLATGTAIALLIAYTVTYVVPLYVWRDARPIRGGALGRDAPTVIRARVRSAAASTAVCCVATALVLSGAGGLEFPRDILHAMGLWPLGLRESVKALALVSLLFVGPLLLSLMGHVAHSTYGVGRWDVMRPWRAVTQDPVVFRNYIAGPITEELLFRSASVPLVLLSPTPVHTCVFLTPFVFGLAHVNHFYERRIHRPPGFSVVTDVLITMFQLSYTTLFGSFASFVLIRTGCVLPAIVVHVFCNFMGFPSLGSNAVAGAIRTYSQEDETEKPQWRCLGLGIQAWTAVYHGLLVVGAFGFWKTLWWLTESENALAKI